MLKELKSQHRNIIQMAFNGYKNNEIAERLGMAPASVSTILRSPLGQAYLNGLQDRAQEATLDVRKKLVSLNKDALKTFEYLLDAKARKAVSASVQFNAAKDVLDRNGYKAPDRLNIDMTFQTKTDEELDAEIAAIEASMSKTAPQGKNLPEIKSSLKKTLSTVSTNSVSPSCDPVSSAICSPDSATAPIEEDQSLEDFDFSDSHKITMAQSGKDHYYFDNDNFDEPASFEEESFVEDPSILENLPVDIFNSGKRS